MIARILLTALFLAVGAEAQWGGARTATDTLRLAHKYHVYQLAPGQRLHAPRVDADTLSSTGGGDVWHAGNDGTGSGLDGRPGRRTTGVAPGQRRRRFRARRGLGRRASDRGQRYGQYARAPRCGRPYEGGHPGRYRRSGEQGLRRRGGRRRPHLSLRLEPEWKNRARRGVHLGGVRRFACAFD